MESIITVVRITIHVNVLWSSNSQKFSGKQTFSDNGCCIHSQELVQGFDQETAAVVMARLTSLKMETEVPYIIFSLLTICELI